MLFNNASMCIVKFPFSSWNNSIYYELCSAVNFSEVSLKYWLAECYNMTLGQVFNAVIKLYWNI